jgi:dolichyl-phosphate-mannose-protein mannosyltransferase
VVWPALALLLWAAAVHATGGFKLTILGFPFTSRDPLRPLALAAVLLTTGYAVLGRREIDDEFAQLAVGFGKAAMPIAIVASLAVGAAGLHWGTFAASGVDAYGYVSQAALWMRGSLRVEQPFVSKVSWPAADFAFAPMGYRPAVEGHAIVPSYAPGLPLLMALAERVAGDCGPYYVVPVLGGLCVWCCYLLGRRAASAAAGACAAVLLACSPVFLFHLVAPMSDVPAAALWSAALYLALGGGGTGASASAGVCAALAVLVRPNLAPLAAVVAACVASPGRGELNRRAAWKRAAWFAAALVPALGAIAIINWRLYGSPARSGYDELGSTYAISHIAANARRYAGWLVQTHTPLIGLSAIGLALSTTRSPILVPRASALFLIFTLGVAASYLPYLVFDEWWSLRFFLPALPVLLVAMTASIFWLLGYLPAAARMFVFVALGTSLVSHELRFAIGAGLTRSQPNERRYVAVARFIEASMPPDAVFLSLQHAGSVRHYANRLTVRFDRVSTGLDDALASLEHAGWQPFILLEDWEEPQFSGQFGGSSELGRLAWRPFARLSEPGGVNIYDPKQAHDAVAHEIAVIPPPRPCDCRHW